PSTQPPLAAYRSASRSRGRPVCLRSCSGSAGARLLVLVGDVLELGVDDLVVLRLVRAAAGLAATRARPCTSLRVSLLGFVHRLAELHRRLGEVVRLGLDLLGILAGQRRLQRLEGPFDRGLLGRTDLVAELLEVLVGRVDQRLALV